VHERRSFAFTRSRACLEPFPFPAVCPCFASVCVCVCVFVHWAVQRCCWRAARPGRWDGTVDLSGRGAQRRKVEPLMTRFTQDHLVVRFGTANTSLTVGLDPKRLWVEQNPPGKLRRDFCLLSQFHVRLFQRIFSHTLTREN
jgi:hypothetical protein